jgi:hypothetical protein
MSWTSTCSQHAYLKQVDCLKAYGCQPHGGTRPQRLSGPNLGVETARGRLRSPQLGVVLAEVKLRGGAEPALRLARSEAGSRGLT